MFVAVAVLVMDRFASCRAARQRSAIRGAVVSGCGSSFASDVRGGGRGEHPPRQCAQAEAGAAFVVGRNGSKWVGGDGSYWVLQARTNNMGRNGSETGPPARFDPLPGPGYFDPFRTATTPTPVAVRARDCVFWNVVMVDGWRDAPIRSHVKNCGVRIVPFLKMVPMKVQTPEKRTRLLARPREYAMHRSADHARH
eukprot:631359-Prymnesium_polylepis.1